MVVGGGTRRWCLGWYPWGVGTYGVVVPTGWWYPWVGGVPVGGGRVVSSPDELFDES